jgi:hypothetical protein
MHHPLEDHLNIKVAEHTPGVAQHPTLGATHAPTPLSAGGRLTPAWSASSA